MSETPMNGLDFRGFLFGEELTKGHLQGATQQLAPEINEITDQSLFGRIWQDSKLSLRDRTLVMISMMASLGHERELGFQIRGGLRHGLSQDEIVGAIAQLMFYIGLPKTHLALRIAQEQFRAVAAENDE